MKRLIQGDSFIISTKEYSFLIQFVKKHENGIPMILVYFNESIIKENIRGLEIQNFINNNDYYELSFMLMGLKKDEAQFIGNYSLPINYTESRYVRDIILDKDNNFRCWSIFDKQNNSYFSLEKLNKKESQIPPDGIWSYPLLLERLEKKWSPEKWK